MTADDHRDARQTSGGNEHQVSVKIECVRNLHLVFAKVTAEIETRAQRLPSKKAAPHWKLGDLAELAGERAAGIHASQMNLKLGGIGILRDHRKLPLRSARLEGINHQKQADGQFGDSVCVYDGSVRGAHPVILLPGPMLTREWPALVCGNRRPREARTGRRA